MKITFELIMAITLTLGLTLAFFEVTRVYEKEYVSNCCSYSYRQITTIDKYNKEQTKNYCLGCRKWCDVLEKK